MTVRAGAFQQKGVGSAFCAARQSRMIWLSVMTARKTPRLRRCLFRVANRPSTALIRKAEVGVKWTWKRGWRSSQRFKASVFCAA